MCIKISAAALEEMFRPPINRFMKVLDRSFFHKTIPISAAKVNDKKQISKLRVDLKHDILHLDRLQVIRSIPGSEPGAGKALLLKPEIVAEDASTWGGELRKLVDSQRVVVVPYDLNLDYDYWNYHDIMKAILPEVEVNDEIPTGFSIIGHIAHLNLREQYLPYKNLIAEVLLDKNPTIRTVINKVDEVGQQSEFRTFNYEVLAGDEDMDVEIREENCLFRFNYSKVYWNSRLNTEHRRLIELFRPGEAVCDVMAGIGPFAVPAGKRKVFVWANDLNPDSYFSLKDAVARNKVSHFVSTFKEDGHTFIRTATQSLLQSNHRALLPPKPSRTPTSSPPKSSSFLSQPKTFAHFIMNLPATATTFLPSFIGLYADDEPLFHPHTATNLPFIHLYCFSTKSENNKAEEVKICGEISEQLNYKIRPEDEDVTIVGVRDVAPQKRMFCATFRLPREVAFRRGKGLRR